MVITGKDEVNNCVVAELGDVTAIEGADRIKQATVCGVTVIVSADSKDGDRVLFFDSNLALSKEYLSANNLYANKELNADKESTGYFGRNGRVKAMKLRGVISCGFVASLDTLANMGLHNLKLSVGDEFTAIGFVSICHKYVAPVKASNMGAGAGKASKRYKCKQFVEHWDTKHYAREASNRIPENGRVWIEEKIHGTSGRIGKFLVQRKLKWYDKLLIAIGVAVKTHEVVILSGTRRVVLNNPNSSCGFYGGGMRGEVVRRIASKLRIGEQVYFELAGYDTNGKHVQKGYPYGCESGDSKAFLYRVTLNDEDGRVCDLSRDYVYNRAKELGLDLPHQFATSMPHTTKYGATVVDHYTSGKSEHCDNTIREGVVVWFVGHDGKWTCLKNKSKDFILAESKAMDKADGSSNKDT